MIDINSKNSTNLINYIEKFRAHTLKNIRNAQEANTPTFFDINAKRQYYYRLDDKLIAVNQSEVVLEVSGLKYTSLYKRRTRLSFKDSLINLIDSKELLPFLLFYTEKNEDGTSTGLRFVKWSKITIVNDSSIQYVIIKNDRQKTDEQGNLLYKDQAGNETINPTSGNKKNTPIILPIVIDKVYAIQLPFNVKYTEIGESFGIDYDSFLSFDDNGLYDEYANTKIYIDKNSNTIDFIKSVSGIKIENYHSEKINDNYKLSPNSIIVFKNQELYPEAEIMINPMNFISIDLNQSDTDEIDAIVVCNTKTPKSKDNALTFEDRDSVLEITKNKLEGQPVPEYANSLIEEFDFEYTKDNYQENITDALNYILLYNQRLLNDYYKEKSNVFSATYLWSDLKSKVDSNGNLIIPRHRTGTNDDYVIMFINGKIYEYYYLIKYETNKAIIPIIGINDNDLIEFLFFTNCHNEVTKVTIKENEATPIDSRLNMENIEFFSQELENTQYNFNVKTFPMLQYKVDAELEYSNIDNETGLVYYDITTDPFYYNKTLTAISANQFRYIGYRIEDESISRELTEEFAFCHNLNRYMVFVNGIKLNKDLYRIVMPTPNTPITDVSIYSNVVFESNSRVDIFYLPFEYEEMNAIPLDGFNNEKYIAIDKSKIAYNFSKDLYFIFVNGIKVNNKDIIDRDSNNVCLIKYTENTVNDLSIIKYIEEDEIISNEIGQYSNFESIMDTINNIMTDEEFTRFKQVISEVDPEGTNGELLEELIAKAIEDKPIIEKIIRDYWLRIRSDSSLFNTTGSDIFVYDYELPDENLGQDFEGNTIFDIMNANNENSIE